MSKPSDIDAMASRVASNAEWFAQCGRLYMADNQRNGAYAREIREAKGVSLRSVAKLMGVSAMFLSDLERGNRVWNSDHAEKWKKSLS